MTNPKILVIDATGRTGDAIAALLLDPVTYERTQEHPALLGTSTHYSTTPVDGKPWG